MKLIILLPNLRVFLLLSLFLTGFGAQAQEEKGFWKDVRYGGSLGLSFGSGYFHAGLAPAALYEFNPYFMAGMGLKGSYTKADFYRASTYGGSIIGYTFPFPNLSFSTEFELLQVNVERELETGIWDDSYLNPALFLGVGYRSGPVIVGVKYDVLYNDQKSVYGSPILPFVSVYF